MIRGSTPTHTFSVPFTLGTAKEVEITYSSSPEQIILQKYKDDCTITDAASSSTVTVTLSQAETLMFPERSDVMIQMRVLTAADDCLISNIITVDVETCLSNTILEEQEASE